MWVLTWIIAAAIGFALEGGPVGALAGIGVCAILGVVEQVLYVCLTGA